MIAVSPELQAKFDSSARTLKCKMIINYTDTLLDPTITASSADNNYKSYPQQMVNGKADTTYKYFELGKTPLGQIYRMCPGNEQSANFNEMGWWTLTRSDGSGNINVTSQIVYSKRKVSGCFLAGDVARNEYAIDYTVKFYNDAVLVYTLVVTANTSVKDQNNFAQLSDINKCVLNITKWSEPVTPVKIAEFTTQVIEEYYDDVICDFSVLEESEISNNNSLPAGNISSNQASICLINNEGRKFDANNTLSRLHGLVKLNSFIEIFLGANGLDEWVPVYKGWAVDWDVPEADKTATATFRDRLNLLTETNINTSTVLVNLTIFEWFELVLNDAGLSNTQYFIDPLLDGSSYIVPIGWLTDINHRAALTQIAEASSSVVYVDRYGLIQVLSLDNFDGTVVKTVTRDDYTDKDNQPVYQNIANKITVTTSPLLKTTGVTVYETNVNEPEEIGASEVEVFSIQYSNPPISDQVASIFPAVAGLSITNFTHYSWGSDIEVTNTGAATTFLFKVVGSTFEVFGQKKITRSDSQSITDNGLVNFPYPGNPFLQTTALAVVIAEGMLNSFKDPQRDLTLNFDVGGNPTIELRDTIAVTDEYTTKNYKIVRQDLVYNGSLGMTQQGRV